MQHLIPDSGTLVQNLISDSLIYLAGDGCASKKCDLAGGVVRKNGWCLY